MKNVFKDKVTVIVGERRFKVEHFDNGEEVGIILLEKDQAAEPGCLPVGNDTGRELTIVFRNVAGFNTVAAHLVAIGRILADREEAREQEIQEKLAAYEAELRGEK